ncbi:MAG: hypothetical protein U1F42_03225 [Candidatus Competibacteraceae bacterium]
MGGCGSGRHWHFGAKDTTDDYRVLDVRRWQREGYLEPGRWFGWQWTRDGETVASIQVRAESDRVILSYRHQSGGGEWKSEEYPVYLDRTPCTYGDVRAWFRCPARGCGRRVAILYGGAIFACRRCYRLAYPSQREASHERATRRADKIRARLGWEPGILNGEDGKPKGMHWRTYERLSAEVEKWTAVSAVEVMRRFGVGLEW